MYGKDAITVLHGRNTKNLTTICLNLTKINSNDYAWRRRELNYKKHPRILTN